MPRAGVRLSDGRMVVVEYEKGATPEQIKDLAKAKGIEAPTIKGVPVVPPETPGLIRPSVSEYLGQGLKHRSGDILATAGGVLAPGRGLLGLAARLGASEVGQEVGDVATGQKVTPGYGAGTQLVGEGVAKAIAPLLSPKTYSSFANRTVKALASKLDELVPSWKELPATAAGLSERAHGLGQRLLSKNFETVIKGLKGEIPETFVVRVPEFIETEGRMEMIDKPRNARALIDELPTLRRAGGKPYRQALKALSDQLPSGISPELDAVRAEYKSGAGWIDFAERGKFLYGEKYDPAKAQAALDKFGKQTLLGRGLDEIREIVRGPGEKPTTAVPHGAWERRLYGATLGEAAGFPFGAAGRTVGPLLGAGVGEAMLPPTTYRHVPLSPAAKFAGRLGTAGVAEGMREAGRDLGVKEQLPGVGGPP